MKQIVIYQSSTGFTKQYAEWIGTALGCEVVDIKNGNSLNIAEYDCVIYGGWIMGNMIMGLDKIRKRNPKNLIVYAVGSTPNGETLREAIRTQNHLEQIPFYYMEGGFHFDKLNFLVRMMLKKMKKSVAKKADKTEQDIYMEKTLGTSFDHSDRKFIVPLVEYVKAGC
ncbi:MAG: hypothetical protein E7256_11160 [Lachnospiraceae bacterium]|nr:hypothetical protein [Lachnospiraceae bacterium]